jgi:hypothetical protein
MSAITAAEFQKAFEPRIIVAWKRYGDGDIRKFAYIQATRKHETGHNYSPIRERWGPTPDQSGYEGRVDLGNNQPGDGERFKGMGDVQMTGRRNYTLYSTILGIDLVGNPDLALDPQASAFICVHGMMNGNFTTRKLGKYINAEMCDFYNARRVVNSIESHPQTIAGYAQEFLAYLQANPQILQEQQTHQDTVLTPSKKHLGVYLGIAASLVVAGVGAAVLIKK